MTARPLAVPGIGYGGDYNPEQWPRETWTEDVRLMREAGVNLVSLGVFSWGLLEPAPGQYDFGWLDEVMDLLHAHDVRVDLATATASTPHWLAHDHPEVLPVDQDGRRLWPGSRQAWCPSSPVYREYAARLVEQLAHRYSGHDALAMWHVGNEYGCHVAYCYCDESARDFRRWLQAKYADIDALNAAWATAFWSQHYTSFDQVLPPRSTPTFHNPTQLIDFRRFSSDALLECFTMERDLLHRLSPGVPVTTNFMANFRFDKLDYWRWAPELDIVSNDQYLDSADPEAHIVLAMSADLARGLAQGRPWIQMEHSTSAVNWQLRNRAKQPREMVRNSMQHAARGADGVLFFQWRASRGGAEKFHSGMVPHGGTDTKIWRETAELGAKLSRLAPLVGSTVRSDVALIFDWESGWAVGGEVVPSQSVRYHDVVKSVYAACWRGGVSVDFVAPGADLGGYKLVLAPCLHMLSPTEAATINDYVEAGGTLLVTYFSGIVDRDDQVVLGGYPGLLRSTLGIVVEEFFPLQPQEVATLDDGSTASVWSERIVPRGAETVHSFASGQVAGGPAVTRTSAGDGVAWYVGTQLDAARMDALVADICTASGVEWSDTEGTERVVRSTDEVEYVFVINHDAVDRAVGVAGTDLFTGASVDETDPLPAGEVIVVERKLTESS